MVGTRGIEGRSEKMKILKLKIFFNILNFFGVFVCVGRVKIGVKERIFLCSIFLKKKTNLIFFIEGVGLR